jgi:hypothetical protein
MWQGLQRSSGTYGQSGGERRQGGWNVTEKMALSSDSRQRDSHQRRRRDVGGWLRGLSPQSALGDRAGPVTVFSKCKIRQGENEVSFWRKFAPKKLAGYMDPFLITKIQLRTFMITGTCQCEKLYIHRISVLYRDWDVNKRGFNGHGC